MAGAMAYVPLSQRSSKEIRAQGEVYCRMARTARTPEAKSGLEALAVRFAALAARLEAEERLAAGEQPASAPAELVQR